jgi:hypothetical protein
MLFDIKKQERAVFLIGSTFSWVENFFFQTEATKLLKRLAAPPCGGYYTGIKRPPESKSALKFPLGLLQSPR